MTNNKEEECGNCRFSFQGNNDVYDNYVDCRRHAPKVFDGVGTSWPTVFVGDWCGEWETRRG